MLAVPRGFILNLILKLTNLMIFDIVFDIKEIGDKTTPCPLI